MPVARRTFLKRTAAIAVGAGLSGSFPLIMRARAVAPSDTVRIGAIGINGMGWTNTRSHLKVPGVEIAALCDVDDNVLQRRAKELADMQETRATLHGDFRELLDRDDIDAVIVATPDHWHAVIATLACEAGKDVYLEKPLANSITECFAVKRTADYHERVLQVGQWQRSGPHWDEAMEFVQSGKLGKVRTAKAWAYQGWMKNIPVRADEPVPAGLNYDMWLGPAVVRPFNPNRFHFNFRWFWDYAGGLMTDWGVHLIDMVLYGMQATAPRAVLSAGGPFAYPDGAMETPDTQQAVFEYDGFTMLWEHAAGIDNGPYGRDHGVAFIGNEGTLVVDRAGWLVIPEGEKMEAVPLRPATESGLDLHTKNFVDCIKSRKTPACPGETGSLAAVNAHLGNIAFKTGRKVYWNHDRLRFEGDDEANNLTRAHFREPWKLPTIPRPE